MAPLASCSKCGPEKTQVQGAPCGRSLARPAADWSWRVRPPPRAGRAPADPRPSPVRPSDPRRGAAARSRSCLFRLGARRLPGLLRPAGRLCKLVAAVRSWASISPRPPGLRRGPPGVRTESATWGRASDRLSQARVPRPPPSDRHRLSPARTGWLRRRSPPVSPPGCCPRTSTRRRPLRRRRYRSMLRCGIRPPPGPVTWHVERGYNTCVPASQLSLSCPSIASRFATSSILLTMQARLPASLIDAPTWTQTFPSSTMKRSWKSVVVLT